MVGVKNLPVFHQNAIDIFVGTFKSVLVSWKIKSVSCIALRPRTNTADLGPLTGLIRNHLINNIIKMVELGIILNNYSSVVFFL